MTRGVSVILPVFNEARSIQTSIRSLLAQDMAGVAIEILAVDGMSDDGTTEQLAAMAATDSRIRVVSNPDRTTPFALNLGLAHATFDYVAVLGAHCDYAPDYLKTCLAVVESSEDIVGCSGRVRTVPANRSLVSLVCNWVMTSRMGSSGKSFRNLPEGPAESIPYPVFRRSTLLAIGGYNTRLTRNQDNDMNNRLIDTGAVLFSTWATTCDYKTPSSIQFLMKYGWRNGRWVAVSLKENRRSMKVRHLAPAVFTFGAVVAVFVAILGHRLPAGLRLFLALAPIGAHAAVGTAEACADVRNGGDVRVLVGPLGAVGFHLAYGAGTLTGLAKPPG